MSPLSRSRAVALTIALSTLCALGAIALRIALTGRITFFFLTWNLFLAWLPWLLSLAIGALSARKAPRSALVALLALWLLLFPNAPYVLTDFVHLGGRGNPLWCFDLLLSSFATLAGWLCALDSLRRALRVVSSRWSPRAALLLTPFVCWLAGFGVYLGRFLRFNSWELVSDPIALLSAIASRLLHPTAHPRTHAFSLGFAALLAITYALFAALAHERPEGAAQTRAAA